MSNKPNFVKKLEKGFNSASPITSIRKSRLGVKGSIGKGKKFSYVQVILKTLKNGKTKIISVFHKTLPKS